MRAGTVLRVAVLVAVSWAMAAWPASACDESTPWRVRSLDPKIVETLREGDRLSASFHRLRVRIDQSDGVVYLENAPCPVTHLQSCLLHHVGLAGGGKYRYLRIHVNLDSFALHGLAVRDLIPIVGHELQHAVEVLDDPNARSAVGILGLLLRLGEPLQLAREGTAYETPEAQKMEKQIAEEVAKSLKPKRARR